MSFTTKVIIVFGLALLVLGIYGAARAFALPDTPQANCSPDILFLTCSTPRYDNFLVGMGGLVLGAFILIYAATRWD